MKANCTTALLFWSLEHASSRFATGVAIRYSFLVWFAMVTHLRSVQMVRGCLPQSTSVIINNSAYQGNPYEGF